MIVAGKGVYADWMERLGEGVVELCRLWGAIEGP